MIQSILKSKAVAQTVGQKLNQPSIYLFNSQKIKPQLENIRYGPRAIEDEDLVNFSKHIQHKMKDLHEEPITGQLAQYIPELRNENPHAMSCSVCTVEGKQFSIGMDKHKFTLQSCIKPFLYLTACKEHTRSKVHQHVGREPSGQAFNSFSLNYDNLPYNPMINSGAITVTGLIKNHLEEQDRFNYIYDEYKGIIRRNEVQEQEYQSMIQDRASYMHMRYSFSYQTYMSEKLSGSRNNAIAHFLNGEGVNGSHLSSEQVAKNLNFYFETCCLKVNTNSAAAMAATIANGGVSPINKERFFEQRHAVSISQIMFSCGMYNYSGNWACNVGIPAKSGVSGLVIAVIPNLMGIAFYSPPLDRLGNSEKAVKFYEWLAEEFHFNIFSAILQSNNDPFNYWKERSKQPLRSSQDYKPQLYTYQNKIPSQNNGGEKLQQQQNQNQNQQQQKQQKKQQHQQIIYPVNDIGV